MERSRSKIFDFRDPERLRLSSSRKTSSSVRPRGSRLDRLYNTYELDYRDNNIKKLDIAEPSDILEFPCMQQAHEDLLEGVPSRWLLYTIARFLFSLDNDFGVDAVHELFSQYDWYDEATTEREARYEYQRGSPDDPIMPIGCNVTNDKFTGYCIGRNKCDHSLYYSVRHKDEVYDNLEDS